VSGQAGGVASVDGVAVLWGIVGLLGITAGTLYQKRYCGGMPMLTGVFVQYAASLAITLPLALLTEELRVDWTPEFIFALSWHVLVLSLGAIGLLYTMIRHGEASRVASVFFLTPGVTAVFALIIFGQPLAPAMVAGLAISATGVALVSRAAKIRA
jgi:drug/metabolite transporter (DMT)-like permease